MKDDPFASNQRFGSPAAGFPPADKDKNLITFAGKLKNKYG